MNTSHSQPSQPERPEKERFAVTGAAGFIGGRLVLKLLSSGHEVIAIVRDEDQAQALAERGAIVRVADVRDPQQLEEAMADATGVFHLAALFNHPDRTWDEYREVNVQGSLNVMAVAKKMGVRRVVYCSTVGVATEAQRPPYCEETPYSPQPDDKYEVTKCEAEQAVRAYAKDRGVSLVVIRPAQVYGPGDRSKVKFYKLVKKGVIVSPGSTRKHLIFIDDLCHAFELAMLKAEADGEVFLIAGKESTPLTRLVSIAAEALKVPYPRVSIPVMPVVMACAAVETISGILKIKPVIFVRSLDFFRRSVECQTRKATERLGFEAHTSVQQGVEATVDWYRRKQLI